MDVKLTVLGKRIKFSPFMLLIVLVGAYFRFYKLDWGEGFFFHPDEYHIVASVNKLDFPSQMNPHFFSYGTFTTYLIYFAKQIFSFKTSVFLIGRTFSALFSTLTIYVVYLISKEIFNKRFYSYLSSTLVAITPGLIQQAHFATPESTLTLWLFLTLLLLFRWIKKKQIKFYLLSCVCLGFAIGTKIVALSFVPILIFLPFIKISLKNFFSKPNIKQAFKSVNLAIFSILLVALTFLTVFPYSFLDWKDFRSSMNYETGVGQGKPVVFYTRQFIDTTPLAFQFTKIFPYALGPSLTTFGILGFAVILWKIIRNLKHIQKHELQLAVLLLGFSLYFFPNAFLFAKWTRFMAPIFPFFSIFSAYFVYYLQNIHKKTAEIKFITIFFTLTLTAVTTVWCVMFFSIYRKNDVRISVTNWINENLPTHSTILTESGNMLEAPLYGSTDKLSYDFYHLDENTALQKQLPQHLANSDYFIIQSRRIFLDNQRLPDKFPATSRFYDLLFSEQLGFKKIREFNSFPKLRIANSELIIEDEVAEETWSVFDHPVIRIYKKVSSKTQQEYAQLLKI